MFLAGKRLDIQFCVKESAREVGEPFCSRHAEGKAWSDVDTLHMMVDSDCATNKVDRKSTSACVAQLGVCTVLSYSRTQGSPALSSAEAERCEGLFMCAVARELGPELKLALHCHDLSAIRKSVWDA